MRRPPRSTRTDTLLPSTALVRSTLDAEAVQYCRHLFYKHEPDLDLTNPRVIHEIERIMSFWLRLGVSGFRIDAAVHMVRQAGGGELEKGYWLLEHMRDFVTMRPPETVLLGEIDTEPEQFVEHFGEESARVHSLLDLGDRKRHAWGMVG